MSKSHTPDLLNTHIYIAEAFDSFGHTIQDEEIHSLETLVMDASAIVPQPHVLQARLTVPLKQAAASGNIRPVGPRRLELTLRSDSMPVTDAFVADTKRILYLQEPRHQQKIFADATFEFTTKKVLRAHGEVYKDGEDIGVEDSFISDGTNKNLLLAYLASLVG